jgi:cold shock CspA family protein
MTGVIYKLFANKGFGFIRGDDQTERFFHAKWMKHYEDFPRLIENMAVIYTPDDKGTGGNKLQARDVEIVR